MNKNKKIEQPQSKDSNIKVVEDNVFKFRFFYENSYIEIEYPSFYTYLMTELENRNHALYINQVKIIAVDESKASEFTGLLDEEVAVEYKNKYKL